MNDPLSIQPRPSQPVRTDVPVPARAASVAGVASNASPGDTVGQPRFSAVGVLLAQLQAGAVDVSRPLPPASPDSINQLLAFLSTRIGVVLREAGIGTQAAVSFDVDGTGAVQVRGDHPQSPAIQQAIDRHADVQLLVRYLHALGAQAELVALSLQRSVAGGASLPATVDPARVPGHPFVVSHGTTGQVSEVAANWHGRVWIVAAVVCVVVLIWLW